MAPARLIGLKTRKDFLHAAGGRSVRRRLCVVQARERRETSPIPIDAVGVGFTATKKIGGAVVRNRAKRRLRAAARSLLPRLGVPGLDYVLIARRDTAEAGWSGLLDDVEAALISLRQHFAGARDDADGDGEPLRDQPESVRTLRDGDAGDGPASETP